MFEKMGEDVEDIFRTRFTVVIVQHLREQKKRVDQETMNRIVDYAKTIATNPEFQYTDTEIINLAEQIQRFTIKKAADFKDSGEMLSDVEEWIRKMVQHILHGENHYKNYDVNQRKQLFNLAIDAYIHLRKIYHVVDNTSIPFDQDRANRFLDWIIYLGSTKNTQDYKVTYKKYLSQSFSEAELLLLHMYLGEKPFDMEYARSFQTYRQPSYLNMLDVLARINMNVLSTILVKLVYTEKHELNRNRENKIMSDQTVDMIWRSIDSLIRKTIDLIDDKFIIQILQNLRTLRENF